MSYKKMIQIFGVDVNKALPKFPDKKNRNFCSSFDWKKTIDSPSRTQFYVLQRKQTLSFEKRESL